MQPTNPPLTTLHRRWWLILLTTAGALLIVLAIDLLATPRYQAAARFLITPAAQEDPGDLVDSAIALDKPTLAATFAEVFSSPTLQRQAALRLSERPISAEELAQYTFSAVVLPETSVLLLTVAGPDAYLAARLANALGEEAAFYLQPFAAIYQLRALDPARPPLAPHTPRLLSDLAVALVIGAATGVALALGLPYLAALVRLPEGNRALVTRPSARRESAP